MHPFKIFCKTTHSLFSGIRTSFLETSALSYQLLSRHRVFNEMGYSVSLVVLLLSSAITTLGLHFPGYKWTKTLPTLGARDLRGGKVSTSVNSSSVCGPCIGIDLGTTYSCVAVWKNGRVEVCPNDQGNRITPSYVAWDDDGQRIVGDAAKNQAATNPINTVFDVKRLIGRKFSDATVKSDSKLFPFKSKFVHSLSIVA